MIRIQRTYDARLIRRVLCSPEIFATVADDGLTPDDFTPDVGDGHCWLRASVGPRTVAIYHFHPQNATTLQLHVNVLGEFRLPYAREATWCALSWLMDNAPAGFAKVVILIPSVYPKTVNFAKKFGFTVEGCDRLSDRVGGALCDRVLLGATFTEISNNIGAQYHAVA